MSGPQPRGESLRRAVRWVSAQLDENPEAQPLALADEASRRFDLNPLEGEYLLRFLRDRARGAADD